MRVTVTQEDWDKACAILVHGVPSNTSYNCCCVLAQALIREGKAVPNETNVLGRRTYIGKKEYRHSKPAQGLVEAFDHRRNPEDSKHKKPKFPKTYILREAKL